MAVSKECGTRKATAVAAVQLDGLGDDVEVLGRLYHMQQLKTRCEKNRNITKHARQRGWLHLVEVGELRLDLARGLGLDALLQNVGGCERVGGTPVSFGRWAASKARKDNTPTRERGARCRSSGGGGRCHRSGPARRGREGTQRRGTTQHFGGGGWGGFFLLFS